MHCGTIVLLTLFITALRLTSTSAEVMDRSAVAASDYAKDDYYYEDDAEHAVKEGHEDGDGDDDDDVYVDDGKGEATQLRAAEVNSNAAYFVQREMEIYARMKDNVLIDCAVADIQANNVIMWYKGKVVIATGQFVMHPNVELLKNNSIIIKNVTASDAGDYYCEALPEKKRMHALLEVDESLIIYCDGHEVTNRSVVFRQGEKHLLECKYYSLEDTEIKWFIEGKRAENVVASVLGDQLYIDSVDTAHGGIYQCLADDRSQEPPHAMFIVDVLYAPKVTTHRHYVNTDYGGDAELYCDYNANPGGEVRWLRARKTLNASHKYARADVLHKGRNRTMLTVRNARTDDLGEYTCRVENTIGRGEAKVHIIYEPEHPQLEDMKVEGRKVTLEWLVRSIQPLSEAVLDYKLAGFYTWSTVSVVHTHRHSDSHIWKVIHEMELTPGSWHVRMKARNTVGWSKFSAQHDFAIDDEEDDLDMDGAPEKMIAMASFGGGAKTQNSSAALRISAAVVIVVGVFMLRLLSGRGWGL